MTLYAESSAVLAWLRDEQRGPTVRQALAGADRVITSDLTLIECDRALLRLAALGVMTGDELADRQSRLIAAARPWSMMSIAPPIVDRARRPFPDDAIRSLDAIHLASALVARAEIGDLALLTLDDRIRTAGQRLGFRIVPD